MIILMNKIITSQKVHRFSSTLRPEDYSFLLSYESEEGLKRSESLREAIQLLKEKKLEEQYAQVSSHDGAEWDTTLNDGLENETW